MARESKKEKANVNNLLLKTVEFGLTVLSLGIVVLFYGLDKTGIITTPAMGWFYVVAGAILVLEGIYIMFFTTKKQA